MIKQNASANERLKKTNSLQRVMNILALYTELQEDEGVDKVTFCKRNNISVRTFTRYLSIIGRFLENYDNGLYLAINEHGNYEIMEW